MSRFNVMHNEAMNKLTITTRVPDELAARLDKYAAEHHWSRATAIKVLIERALEQERQS